MAEASSSAEGLVFGRSLVFGRVFGNFMNRRLGFGRRSKISFLFNTDLLSNKVGLGGGGRVLLKKMTGKKIHECESEIT